MASQEGDSASSGARFTRPLGEAGYGLESGHVGGLNLLARAGLPLPEGVIVTREAHREFAQAGGLLRGIETVAGRPTDIQRGVLDVQLSYASAPVEGELNEALCEALIGLGAPSVAVVSEDLLKGELGSIPEVRQALRDCWLSSEGLKRQIEALARGEDLPTWPVLIQLEIRPEYTGWSGALDSAKEGLAPDRFDKRSITHLDVRFAGQAPSQDRRSMARLTLEAEHVLKESVRLRWGLKGGQWYVLLVDRLSGGETGLRTPDAR
jgi:hypothetical protein